MKDFNNKTVYITGGSSGIGLAAAKMLAQKGPASPSSPAGSPCWKRP